MVIHGYSRLYIVINGYIWLHTVIHRLYMVKHGYTTWQMVTVGYK